MIKFVISIMATLIFSGCETNAEISSSYSPVINSCSGQLAKPRSDKQINDSPSPWCISSAIYPFGAHQDKVEGFVLVNFSVTKSGEVTNIRVLESEPEGIFDQAAIDSLKRSFYVPSSRAFNEVTRRIVFKIAKTDVQP